MQATTGYDRRAHDQVMVLLDALLAAEGRRALTEQERAALARLTDEAERWDALWLALPENEEWR